MEQSALQALQKPLKERYRDEPAAAVYTLRADGRLGDENVSCSVETGRALVEAGLHSATGGDGMLACSGDMLLQALVACAGVTLGAVSTSLGIPVRGGTVHAEGDLDFLGTLAVAHRPGRADQLQDPAAEKEDRAAGPFPEDVQAEDVAVEGDGPAVVDGAEQDTALEDFHRLTFSPNGGRASRTRRRMAGSRGRG